MLKNKRPSIGIPFRKKWSQCDALDCPFKYEIIDAIERKKNPPITIKGVEKEPSDYYQKIICEYNHLVHHAVLFA
mgnify:CR=1 FL=1